MQINRFEPVLILLNRFTWLKHLCTMKLIQFKPVLFTVNRFNRLKHEYSLWINRFETGFIHAKPV